MEEAPIVFTSLYCPVSMALVEPFTSVITTAQSLGMALKFSSRMTSAKSVKPGKSRSKYFDSTTFHNFPHPHRL